MNVRVKFGAPGLNVAELFDSLPPGPGLRTLKQYYYVTFCSRFGLASDATSGTFLGLPVIDMAVKF